MSTTALPESESLDSVLPVASASSLLGASTGELVLRMNNGPHSGRIVRLSSAKCSIGSSPDCTLRLRGAGLDPVHCVILRGQKQTIVRRWATDTRLNDRRFEDLPLRTGDRLAVGPIEIQVLSLPGEVREAVQAVRRLDVELAASTARLERLTERLDLANRQGRRRLRAVLAKLRKYQLRLTELETRRSRLADEHQALSNERTRLQASQETLERERRELEHEVRRSAEAAAAAEARRDELERRAAALAEREAELTVRLREAADRAAAQAAEEARLQAVRAEHDRARSEAERARAEAERAQQRLSAREAEATAQRTELEQRAAAVAQRQAAVAAEAQELDRRSEQLAAGQKTLAEREAALNVRIAELRQQAEDLARREAEIGTRCEALKNHWTVLTERESKLERDQAALDQRERQWEEARQAAEQQVAERQAAIEQQLAERQTAIERQAAELQAAAERQAAAEQAAVEREAAAARVAAAAPSSPQPEVVSVVDPLLVERAAELERALELARADLAAMQADQTKRETALHDVQAAHDLEVTDRRRAVEAEAADLEQRRATVELAARTLERWAAMVEEWNAAAAANAAETATAAAASSEEIDEVRAAAERQALIDRLELEKLEAELKTWQDEARLWKSRFEEADCGPRVGRPQDEERTDSETEIETTPEQPETDEAEPATVGDEPEADPVTAESIAEVESPAEMESPAEVEIAQAASEPEAEDEPVAEEPTSEAPKSESAADVLRRMGLTAALDDEPAAAESPRRAAAVPPPAPRPVPAPQPAAAAAHHDGDESLDVYMQQLFQRLGVKQGAQPAEEEKPKATVAAAVSEDRAAEKSAEPAPALPPLQPGEFKARSSAAERRSDLSALRELANFQAKTAITKHQIHRKSTGSKSKLTIALSSLGLGLYGVYSYFVDGRDVAKYGAVAGLAVAVLYVLQSLGLKLQAKKSARSLDDVIQKTAARGQTMEVGAE